jgi:hypothetical protein
MDILWWINIVLLAKLFRYLTILHKIIELFDKGRLIMDEGECSISLRPLEAAKCNMYLAFPHRVSDSIIPRNMRRFHFTQWHRQFPLTRKENLSDVL